MLSLVLFWAFFIFATSSTVIRPQEFFDWIHEHLIQDDALFAGFGVFWGFAWFAIVKGWHAVEFALLLLFSVATINWLTGRRTTQNIAICVAFCIVFAASDEWHQTFVPDRGGTITDVLIDSVGVLVAAAFLLRNSREMSSPRRTTDVTASQPTDPKPKRRWFHDSPWLLRRPLGLPVFETIFVLLVTIGVIVALLLPLIQWIRQVVR